MAKRVGLPVGIRRKMGAGDTVLEEAGLWPFAPLTGPMAHGPVFSGEEDMMDYRQINGQWTRDPGWWKRLKGRQCP